MTQHEYARYGSYPKAMWRWPDFTPREMRSKGDGKLMIDPASMDKLQALRNALGRPISITSAYRSAAHNRSVGGAKNSLHMKALAFDVSMVGHNPARFEAEARRVGFTGFGFYERSNFIHIDTGRAREWGKRWFKPVHSPVDAPKPKAQLLFLGTKPKPQKPSRNWLGALINFILSLFERKSK